MASCKCCRRCPCSARTCWLLTLAGGLLAIVLGLVCAFVAFPALISAESAKELDLWNDESEGYKNFYSPPVPVSIKFYMYEVTNADDVENSDGDVKPRLEERGPYCYVEDRLKVNVTDKDFNEFHIQFGQRKTYYFHEELSCSGCSEDDVVTVINPPLIGVIRIVEDLALPPDLEVLRNILLRIVNELLEGRGAQDLVDLLWSILQERYPNIIFGPPTLNPDCPFFADQLFLRNWTVHEILWGGVQPGSVHLIKLVEGVVDAIAVSEGRMSPAEFDARGHREVFECDVTHDNLPAWASGEPCDHSRAPWDTADGDAGARSLFRGSRRVPKGVGYSARQDDGEEGGLVIPWVIGDCGFSALTGKNGTEFQEWYETNTGASNMDDYMEIERWGLEQGTLFEDLTPASWWTPNNGYQGSNLANLLRGTDGQQFHPDVKEEETIWTFQTDICRVIYGEFVEEQEILGIDGLRFVIPAEAFQVNTQQNIAYCKEYEPDAADWDSCIRVDPADTNFLILDDCNITEKTCPDGLMEVTRCYQGAPVTVSSPRFYQSPDFMRDPFDNFQAPVPAEHETTITVEPYSGTSIVVKKRLQVNTNFMKNRLIDAMDGISDDFLEHKFVFPLFWLEEGADLDQENADLLHDIVVLPVTLAEAAQWTFVAVGAAMVVVAAGFLVWMEFFRSPADRSRRGSWSAKSSRSQSELSIKD